MHKLLTVNPALSSPRAISMPPSLRQCPEAVQSVSLSMLPIGLPGPLVAVLCGSTPLFQWLAFLTPFYDDERQ